MIFDERGEWETALFHLDRAVELQQRSELITDVTRATVLGNRARIRGRMGYIEEAERMLSEALELAESARSPELAFYVPLYQAEMALRSLGSHRCRQLPDWLESLDRSLKAEASRGPRARLAIERFFCMMSPSTGKPHKQITNRTHS